MSTLTTNMGLGKAVNADNANTVLVTTDAAAKDLIDVHVHNGSTTGLGVLNLNKGTALANAADVRVNAGLLTFRDNAGSPANHTLVDLDTAQTITAEKTFADVKVSGLTGAVAASRYVGATASGVPASGTFAVGDFIIDQTGKIFVCTVAGTPGTWVQVGASTLTAIGDTTLGVATTNITFSGIPGTYKHLQLVIQSRGDGATANENVLLQFNADTAANYDQQLLSALNNVASGAFTNGATSIVLAGQPAATSTAGAAAAIIADIPNYAGTTFWKSVHARGGHSDALSNNYSGANAGNWRSTAAITSIKIFPTTSTNFVAGTRATLYGLS